MSNCFFNSYAKFLLTLLNIELTRIEGRFPFVEFSLKLGKTRRSLVHLIEHIHNFVEKSTDVSKTPLWNRSCFVGRHFLNRLHFFRFGVKHIALSCEKVRFVHFGKFFTDEVYNPRVKLLRPASHKVEYPLVVYAQGVGELGRGQPDGCQHLWKACSKSREQNRK